MAPAAGTAFARLSDHANLADPIRVDSATQKDPMSRLAVVMLALFSQMERTYAIENAAHARAVGSPSDGVFPRGPSAEDF